MWSHAGQAQQRRSCGRCRLAWGSVWNGLAGLVILLPSPLIGLLPVPAARAQMTTEDRVELPGWWPTQGRYKRTDYVGPDVCATCHSAEAEVHKMTPMAQSEGPSEGSNILRQHNLLTVKLGDYTYTIRHQGERTLYTVMGRNEMFSQPLQWAMGLGVLGQTFVYERQGAFFEARVSFFSSIDRLDLTPGQHTAHSDSPGGARGRPLSETEARQCFGCHTTAAVTENRLDPSQLIPGVTCEACHGPGAKHVAAVKAGKDSQGTIFNPITLKPVDSVDFCGACHRAWWDVKMSDVMDEENVRFQPYRLMESRCWNPKDARIECLACHDPHEPLVTDLSSYDSKCLACHATSTSAPRSAAKSGPACPVKGENCVSCHMPGVVPPGLHFTFRDHRIRIPRPGGGYPA